MAASKIGWLSLIALILVQTVQVAAMASSPCQQSDVESILLPIHSNEPASTFNYSYRVLKSSQPGAITVIYIPGGPGDNSIGTSDPRPSPDYNLILTDPRGGGCNTDSRFQSADITGDAISSDIVRLIKHLRLTNYVVHGLSYGTVVATLLANKLGQIPIAQPHAILLEGTLGRYIDFGLEPHPLDASWRAAMSNFPAGLQDQVNKASNNPFGSTDSSWWAVLENYLYFGEIYWTTPSWTGENLFAQEASLAQGGASDATLDNVYQLRKSTALPRSQLVFQSIICQEIFSTYSWRFSYVGGHFLVSPDPICAGNIGSASRYDSAKWQIPQPVIYFGGEYDNKVGLKQTEYHYSHQKNARLEIQIKGGGHRGLQFNLRDCMVKIVTGLSQPKDLESNLKACKAPMKIFKDSWGV